MVDAVPVETENDSSAAGAISYQLLFDAHPQPMWVYDRETLEIVRVNDAATEKYGYSRAEFLNRTIKDLRPADDVPVLLDYLSKDRTGSDSGIWRHALKSGEIIAVQITSRDIELGGRRCRLVVSQDVTGRLHAERRLERAEMVLRSAGRLAQIGAWRVQLDSMRLHWSEVVCAIHEVPQDFEPSIADAIAFYSPEWRNAVREAFESCRKHGASYQLDAQIVTATNRRLWVRIAGEAVRDPSGRIIEVQGALQNITDRKLAESSLRESDERFRQLADAMPMLVWTAGPDGTVDYVSQSFYDFLGKKYAGARPSDWLSALHPADRERVVPIWQECVAKGTPYSIEFRLHGGAGQSFRWHWVTAKPIRDEHGAIIKWFGSATDIDERKQADRLLRESEGRLRAIFDNEPECVKVVSREGTLLELNPAGRAMFGIDGRAALAGRDMRELVHREDWDTYWALHERACAGENGQRRFRIVGLDGDERWVEAHATPMRIADGEVESVLSVARDVTDRLRAERALAEVRRQTESILNSIADGVHVLDVHGRIRRQNPAAAAMLGWQEGDLVGHPFLGLVHRRSGDSGARELEECAISRTLTDGIARADVNDVFYRKDGGSFPVEYAVAPLRDDTGKVAGAVVSFRDVTSRKRDEAVQESETDLLKVISQGLPLTEALERMLRSVEGLVAPARATVLLLDDTGTRVRHCAAPSLPEAFRRAFDNQVIGPAAGSCGTAMHRGEPVVVSDIETDPLWQDYRTVALGNGLRACWSVPVKGPDGGVLGSFALYYDHPRVPLEGEMALVGRFARLVGSAIDRLRAVDSLRESEERFRQLAENIEEVFWMRDPAAGGVLYVSPAYEAVWGRSREELYRRPETWLEAVHESDMERVRATQERHLISRFSEEYRIVRPDGEIRWISDRSFPVHDSTGSIYRIVGTARDITARKAAENALRESQQLFEAASRATVDVLWDWNFVTDGIWWSEDFQKVFGFRRSDFASATDWTNRIHPDDRDRVRNDIREAIDRRVDFWQSEYRYQHADGRMLDIDDRGVLVFGDDGEPVRIVGGMTDITERKRQQRALRERIKELRCLYNVLELVSDSGLPETQICDDVARILPSSLLLEDVAVARIGLQGREHRSANWHEPLERLRSPIAVGGQEYGFVEVGYCADKLPAESDGTPFLGEERALVAAVATHIARMIEGRQLTAKLTQAERLSAVGGLTGGIAHDFNNLLTVILGNAELLADSLSGDPRLGPLAQMIGAAAERGAELTSRLLAFARRQALAPAAVSIDILVEGMRGLLERTLGENIEIRVLQAPGLWRAETDPSQFESAVLNLCINARDAMPGGGVLTLEMSNIEIDDAFGGWGDDIGPGSYVVLSVSDTGDGMAPDVLARAFEPFFTTKDVGKGSGLGLSMVYGFARQSGGFAKISSNPGLGTTVLLYLPKAVASGTETVAPADALPDQVPASGHVLLVEDDGLVRSHVAGLLENMGFAVTGAASAAEALEMLNSKPGFDLLFSDVMMPGGMNGRELADTVRKLRPDLPILLTSGYSDFTGVPGGDSSDGVEFLHKPYRIQELSAKLRALMGIELQ